MKFTRRNFLAWASLSAVGAVACGVGVTGSRKGELDYQSPVRMPEDLVNGQDNWYATLCRHCPSSEGIIVRVMEGRAKKVQGNPLYPTNQGKQSARCDAGLQALYHPDRLKGPMRRRRDAPRGSEDSFEAIDWLVGLDTLKGELQRRGAGMLLVTEPLRGHLGMVAGRFASAFGGRHLAFEPIDNITYRAAVKNVFGQDLLPDFDLEHANYILSFGADFLSTWVSPTRWGRGYGEFRQGVDRRRRGTLVQVEPRFSMTAANADRWVPLRPGMEGYLALSLAYVIISENRQAAGVDVMALTGGRGAELLGAFKPETVAGKLGLPGGLGGVPAADFIRQLAREFTDPKNRPSLAIGGGEAAAHSNGLFNLQAVYALNYLVGSVGAVGGIKFNPGSPIRELPAVSEVGSLGQWSSVSDDLRGGKTSMLLVRGVDLVHGLPKAVGLQAALDRQDLFIVSFSPFMDDTTAMADLILPDRVYLEDWGDDIPEPGPGYQVLGIQQPVVNPLSDFNPRSFADILLLTAQELGKDGNLPWPNFREVLRDGANKLFALNRGSIQATSPEDFWTKLLRQGGWWDQRASGSAPGSPPRGLLGLIVENAKEAEFRGLADARFHLIPFLHNTLLDGRGARLPWLQGAPDPLTTVTWQTWVEMNAQVAKKMGLKEGDVVEVQSSRASIRAMVYPNPAMPPDVVGIPLGQGHASGSRYDKGRGANVMDILEPSLVEHTGALAWGSTRVRILPTGESVNVSKLEGLVPAYEVGHTPGEQIIHTVKPKDT